MALDHISVLITRPAGQADAWLRGFAQEGAEVFHQPGLTLEASAKSEPSLAHLQQLAEGTAVVYTSPMAVSAALTHQPQLTGYRSWAVGRQTAKLLIQAGCREVLAPVDGSGADALLADRRFAGGSPVLIACARGGRQAIARALEQAGETFHCVYVYQRSPAPLQPQIVDRLADRLERLVVVATSVGILERVHELLGDALPLARCPLVVVSERIAQRARQLGYEHVVVSQQPGLDSVLMATHVAAGRLPI